jgi:hypothetical protein
VNELRAAAAKLSPSAYGTLAQAGFSFVNDAALSSFTSTVVLDAASLATTSPTDANYGTAVSTVLESAGSLASQSLFNGSDQPGLALSTATTTGFGTTPVLSLSGNGFSVSPVLTDLGGSVKLNLSAAEFIDLARRNGLAAGSADKAVINVANTSNVQLAGESLSSSTAPIVGSSSLTVVTTNPANRAQQLEALYATKTDIEVFQSTFTTLATANQQQGNYNLPGETVNNGKYFFNSDILLNATQIRSLPQEGVMANSTGILTLKDTAANLSSAMVSWPALAWSSSATAARC